MLAMLLIEVFKYIYWGYQARAWLSWTKTTRLGMRMTCDKGLLVYCELVNWTNWYAFGINGLKGFYAEPTNANRVILA